MYTFIKGIVTAEGKIKKLYEESSIFKEYIFKKMRRENPSGKEFVLVYAEGGILKKGAYFDISKIKPIIE
jgi:hypothetical protein